MPAQENQAFPAPDRDAADEHDAAFERNLPAALTSTARVFPPPPADLVGRAVRRGRRLRLMRGLQIGAGAVLALGGTLVGVGVLGHDTLALRHVSPATGATTPPPRRPVATAEPVSGAEMIATLESLLPKGGTFSHASGHGSQPDTGNRPQGTSLTAALTYTTSHGSSGIDITIRRLSTDQPTARQAGGCLPVEVRPYDVCTITKLQDGSVRYTTKSFTYPSNPTGQRRWYVELVTGSGADLFLEEFSGGAEKGTTTNSDPVLSIDQLNSIVTSPAWQKAIAAAPVPAPMPAATADPQQTLPGARMARLLTSLLPKGGTTTDQSSDFGLVQLVYDDGHGKNMVEVDDQRNMTAALAGHLGCSGVAAACQSLTLADGTKVKVEQTHGGGSGVVIWLVDTLRPDGRRVAVRDCNSYSENGPMTRPKPALSLAQLQAIALNPGWLG